jgi:hypothetical protein
LPSLHHQFVPIIDRFFQVQSHGYRFFKEQKYEIMRSKRSAVARAGSTIAGSRTYLWLNRRKMPNTR